MSTNSLQLNWNSQILTEEDGHFKLLGCDNKPTKYTTRTRCQCSDWLFLLKSGSRIKKKKKTYTAHGEAGHQSI